MRTSQSTRMLVEAGIMIGLAMVLNMITVFKMPFGGSITAGSMIPILIFALRWGVGPGVLVGMVFGGLQAVFGGYVVSLWQGLLDYPVAFGMLGLAGLFSKHNELHIPTMIAGITIAAFMRFTAHVVSGVAFFAEYAPEGVNPWWYAITYNAGYMGAELIVTLCVASAISAALKKQLVVQN